MLITIGITAFNAENTVSQAIGSALAQSWRPLEIIVVDDASTDDTRSVIDSVAGQHENISLISNARNSGIAAARNEIIERARGDFIAFFDDDDVSVPQRIELQFNRLVDYERAFAAGAPVVCHTAREQVYPDGSRRILKTMGTNERRTAPSGLPVARRELMGTPMRDGYGSCATCSQMARTNVYRMLGGFDVAFRRVEDTEFCVRLARAGGHFPGIAIPLVVQSMTKTTDKALTQQKRYTMAMLEKHRDLFEDEVLYRFCCEWVDLKYLWLSHERAAFVGLLAQLALSRPSLTLQRLYSALPSVGDNLAFRRFHRGHVG